jgi:agmatine deiminase
MEIIRIPVPPIIKKTIKPSDHLHKFLRTLTFEDGTKVKEDQNLDVILPSSYCNFLISNGVVLMSKYYKDGMDKIFEKMDEEARKILQNIFPDRDIVQLDVESINAGGGGIHCITQHSCCYSMKIIKTIVAVYLFEFCQFDLLK